MPGSSRPARWASRFMLVALAAVFALGMWMAPKILFELRTASSSPAGASAPLPVEVAVPKSAAPSARLVPPAERPREVLPLHFAPQSAQSLLDGLQEDGTAANPNLQLWDMILLGRLLAIDDVTADRAAFFGTDYLGVLLAFAAESLMDPLAQGPQIDDRGLGQVGYWVEATGRRWLSDPGSMYYFPGFNPDRSVWEPETNIVLTAAMTRWVYTSPEVRDPLTAYAVYTRGHMALQPDGRLEFEAQTRFNRAESYRGRMLNFLRLKLGLGEEPEDPIVRSILAIDRSEADGRATYRALRDFYMQYLEEPETAYAAVLLAREALTYTDLLNDIYAEPQRAEYERLLAVLQALTPYISPGTVGAVAADYSQTVARLESRLGR